jgi:hypothetical protein
LCSSLFHQSRTWAPLVVSRGNINDMDRLHDLRRSRRTL